MSTTTVRRPNRAAARALRAEILAARSLGATPLPPAYLEWLDQFVPGGMPAPQWAVLRPFVQEVLQRTTKRGIVDLKKRTRDIAEFAAWLQANGTKLDPEVAMTRGRVDEYCRTGMSSSIEKSRADRRSRLRGIADQVNPDQAPLKAVPISRELIRGPYTEDEVAAILRAISSQPTPLLVRQLAICVGLGLGAGIDSAELKLLFPHHVVQGVDGIRVDIPGPRARTVWVRRELEPVVRGGLEASSAAMPLIGRNPGRSNVAAKVFDNATWVGNLPKLDQARLRTTWIAWLMQRPVPLAVICTAAGLSSTRTLFDLIPHLTIDVPAAVLRDGGAR